MSLLKPALAAALLAAPLAVAPAFAQDHQHDGQTAPAPQTPQPNAPCPMMKGMMGGQPGGTMPMPKDGGAAPAPGASSMPMAPDKMANMPCLAKPATAPEPPHDHDHPSGQ
ncbi:hypothetical protein ACFQ1E_14070 [Sphingomonas canadensis]|uniref:Copper resistance protein B n=1 Tax=Sphingomonas canadensis TaxID=1219257 RepID=A0ABW3H7J9_9SPHN|nr:hypothetical protein [Sphingomonas canadensis]MCW3837289.1 hypothetical protein [Sphingomonas canadensis]